MWFSYDFGTSTVAVKSLLWLWIRRDFQILALSIAFFLSRQQQIDDKWFNHDTLQVALDQISRMSAKKGGCLYQFPWKLAVLTKFEESYSRP